MICRGSSTKVLPEATGRLQNAATGLGLYLAKTVFDKIGIQLSVHSGAEGGTRAEMAFTLQNEYDRIRK